MEAEGQQGSEVNAEEYFRSYENLDVHRLMLEDDVRTNAYKNVIYDAKDYFADKVVMDVGAGTGILSLICAKAGARKVIAVEASSLALSLPSIVEKNGYSGVIEVMHSRVEDLSLGYKVDVIVSEWMGFYLLHESMLDSVLFARDHFLKANGVLLPNRAQIHGAPCSLPELWGQQIGFWSQKHYDFDFSPLSDVARVQPKPEVHTVAPDALLSEPQLLWDLDLATVTSDALARFSDRRFFSLEVEDEAEMHGVCLWFTVKFQALPGSSMEEDELQLSTAPWDLETHWKQTVILFPSPLKAEAGDIFGWALGMTRDSTEGGENRSYKLQLEVLSDDQEHPVPCECGTVKCEIIKNYITQQPQAQITQES